jgi:hypothetical protein
MGDVEQALKDLSEKYRSGLVQLQSAVDKANGSNPRQYEALKRQRDMFRNEQALVDKARDIAGGNQAAINDIDAVIRNRATAAHTRMFSALLLGMIDSQPSLSVLIARIVDKTDTDGLRFFCALQVTNSRNGAAIPLILRAINDKSTDEEFDEDAKLRKKMEEEGVPVNLRRALILGLLDSSAGANALAARLRAPATFQNGWLFSILSIWAKTEEDAWVELAASVLKDKSHPEALRVSAATALYIMRKETRGKTPFPRAAWDALRSTWTEREYGKLHGIVGDVLKLQGA